MKRRKKATQKDRDAIWKLVSNKTAATRIFGEYAALHKTRLGAPLSATVIKRDFLNRTIYKLGSSRVSGSLSVVYSKPRPVKIEYLDSGETEEIITIPQIAMSGTVNTPLGQQKLYQIFVGRVFPQWRCRS